MIIKINDLQNIDNTIEFESGLTCEDSEDDSKNMLQLPSIGIHFDINLWDGEEKRNFYYQFMMRMEDAKLLKAFLNLVMKE